MPCHGSHSFAQAKRRTLPPSSPSLNSESSHAESRTNTSWQISLPPNISHEHSECTERHLCKSSTNLTHKHTRTFFRPRPARTSLTASGLTPRYDQSHSIRGREERDPSRDSCIQFCCIPRDPGYHSISPRNSPPEAKQGMR